MGCKVSTSLLITQDGRLTGIIRAVAFMDLGLLIIANCIMRTRLPPKKNTGDGDGASVRGVLRDIPFLVYVFGTFLVSSFGSRQPADLDQMYRCFGEYLFHVGSLSGQVNTLLILLLSLLPPTVCRSPRSRSSIREIFRRSPHFRRLRGRLKQIYRSP